MKITLWGARGDVSAIHPDRSRYGVSTPCVLVEHSDADPIILDGGIGLHWLGNALMAGAFGKGQGRAQLFFSHTNWCHIQGVPFFVPLLIPGNSIRLCGGGSAHGTKQLLLEQMRSTYCPVPDFFQDGIGAHVDVCDLDTEPLQFGPLSVEHQEVGAFHGAQRLGFRISDGANTLAYIPAIEYVDDALQDRAEALARDADLLIHDAYYTDAELAAQKGAGHSCPAQALQTARRANAKRLVLFNHHPERTDDALDAAAQHLAKSDLPVEFGREKSEYSVG